MRFTWISIPSFIDIVVFHAFPTRAAWTSTDYGHKRRAAGTLLQAEWKNRKKTLGEISRGLNSTIKYVIIFTPII